MHVIYELSTSRIWNFKLHSSWQIIYLPIRTRYGDWKVIERPAGNVCSDVSKKTFFKSFPDKCHILLSTNATISVNVSDYTAINGRQKSLKNKN